MSDEESRRVLHSTSAALFSQLWRVGLTFVTHLLLRRLIPAEDWGAWNWAEPIFLVLTAFRDMGLPAHVVRVHPRPLGNLLAVEVVSGVVLVLLVWAGAPLLALVPDKGHPDLVGLLRLMALYVLFDGLAKVPRVWFESELSLREAIVPELLRNALYATTAVLLAVQDMGVWSLAIAYVLSHGVFALLLWRRAWGRIPLVWLRGRTWSLLKESSPLALIWILVLLTTYVDALLIGSRFPFEILGAYGFAYYVAFLVSSVMVEPVSRVLYPALVRFREERGRVFEAYRLATVLLLSCEVPAALGLFVNAELAIRILGGKQDWLAFGAATFLRVLCFAPIVDPLGRFGGDVLIAHHRDRSWIAAQFTTLVWFVAAGLAATSRFGPIGMAFVDLLPLGSLVLAVAISRLSPYGLGPVLRALARVYLVPVPLFACAWWLGGENEWMRAGLSVIALLVTFAVYVRVNGPAFAAFFAARRETPGH